MSPNHPLNAPGGSGPFRGLEEALNVIHACSSIEGLSTAMHALANQLGYASFTYAAVPRLPLVGTALPFHFTQVRADFYATYKSENFIRYDPVWIRAVQRRAPFTWADCPEFSLLGRRGPRTQARRVMETAHDFGYTQGTVVPVHAMDERREYASALVSLYWEGPLKDFRPPGELPLWFPIAARFLHERVMELQRSGSSSDPPCPPLTARERDCLVWIGQGKTYSETAVILGIDTRTVEFHIQNVMRKLEVHKALHAVAIAVSRGLISL
jgi:DNA-binding CsgD family transcriptional regulator